MDAISPYGSHPAADVVLRSCDDVHFYVLGSLLRYVSPFFMDLFLINQPAVEKNEKLDGRPVIPLDEDSKTLHLLLDFLYPRIGEPPLTDFTLFWNVAKAAQKYVLDVVEGKLKDRIVTSDLISGGPLRIYAIAIDLGWDGVAIEAARRTLQTPLENLAFADELRSISGSEFYRFLEYRLRCDKSPDEGAEELVDLPRNVPGVSAGGESANADPIVQAPHPFNSSKRSDLIFRSSDSVDFFVTEALIRLVSEDFDNVFSLQNHDGTAMVQVAEDSKTLHQLLNIIYYYEDAPDTHDYQLYKDVVEAARGYKMSVIEKKLQRHALASPLIQNEPLRIYILATALHWDDVAKSAALNTLSRPLEEMIWIEELNRITGEELYRLARFRFACGEAVSQSLQANSTFNQYGPSQWRNYWQDRRYRYNEEYTPISDEELYAKINACPRGSTVGEIYTSELEKLENQSNNGGLNYNGGAAVCHILKCWNGLGNEIEEVISKVPLAIS